VFRACLTGFVATAAFSVSAQQYPTKSIRLVVPFAAGSTTDIVARILAPGAAQALGQQIIIDNRAGGDGAIAGELVAKAPGDGYTLIMSTNSPHSAVPHLRKKPPYDAVRDFTPITLVGRYTFVLAAHPSVPVKTMGQLFDLARKQPDKLAYASGNTSSIVITAMLNSMAGTKMLHVPYKSEPPAVVDLISGQVQVMVSSYSTIAGHLKGGRLRALATALPNRSPLLPDVPTVAEAGMPKFSIIPWAGLLGPANMPRPVVERLNREFNAQIKRPEVRSQFEQNAFAGEGTTPEFFGDWVRTQLDVWGKIMREAGIQPE
jgi:tripartite-type tricarboxylate transporter receptor subunit TctC